jgi:Acetyltransferase (GNAT) domain
MTVALQPRTVEIDVNADSRWAEFVAHHPEALIYHHPNWLAAIACEYKQKCRGLACEDNEGNLRAILPLFYTPGLPFKLGRSASASRFSSLPRTPVAGPLALDDESLTLVLQQAVKLVRAQPGVQLELKSYRGDLCRFAPELSCVPWRSSYVQELPAQLEDCGWEEFCEELRLPRECGPCDECRRLRFGNARRQHRVNWAVNKALKLGLHVREAESVAEVEQWYRLYLDAMRHHAFPPRPKRFFLDLWSNLRPLGQMKLLVAERDENETKRIVAGSIFLLFGQTVFYAFTGCAHADFHLHPHDIIQMESIRSSCKNGYRWYDFGEATDEESLAQFKGKWGTETKPLYRYHYPARGGGQDSKPSRLVAVARRSWRSLPLSWTAALGEQIHRYL